MTVPTNFYTQQASLLPTGLQSLISGMQTPGSIVQPAAQTQPQTMVSPQMQQFLSAMGQPQQNVNYNQVAQQAAPIYQPPATVPAPQQIAPPVQPAISGGGQGIVRPIQGNSINRLSAQ